MMVRELLQRLLDHALDGRGVGEPVLVATDGQLLTIESVETRISDAGDGTDRDLFILIVADGPADISEPSAITLRTPGA